MLPKNHPENPENHPKKDINQKMQNFP